MSLAPVGPSGSVHGKRRPQLWQYRAAGSEGVPHVWQFTWSTFRWKDAVQRSCSFRDPRYNSGME